MTCERCEALEERIAWLESELGIQRDADKYARMYAYFSSLTATPPGREGRKGVARFILVLHQAKGRVLTHDQLMMALPPVSGGEDERDPKITSVWARRARMLLGSETILTVTGMGYQMSAEGLARVSHILANTPVPPPVRRLLRASRPHRRWNDKSREELVRLLFMPNATYDSVAAELGITRSAVAGQAYRLGVNRAARECR